jgi:hypothetical protein
MVKLQLNRFDMSKIKDDQVVMFIGKRNTGKSFLVRDLLWHKQHLPVGTVISPTESANCFFGKMVPPVFIHDDFDPALLENVWTRQKNIMERVNAGQTHIDPRAFLIMDDCLADSKAWINDRTIRNVFMNGRHRKLFFILTSQYALGIPPTLRNNIDYTFILREPSQRSRKILYENYASMFPTFGSFNQVMDACTSNYECLVIDNTTQSNDIEDMVFWYKADAHDDFKIGAREFWEKNAKYQKDRRSDPGADAVGLKFSREKIESVCRQTCWVGDSNTQEDAGDVATNGRGKGGAVKGDDSPVDQAGAG